MTDLPLIQQHGCAVIIQGEALPLLYRATLALAARHRRDGLASPALLHQIRAALFRAATSRPRHKDAGDPTGGHAETARTATGSALARQPHSLG